MMDMDTKISGYQHKHKHEWHDCISCFDSNCAILYDGTSCIMQPTTGLSFCTNDLMQWSDHITYHISQSAKN